MKKIFLGFIFKGYLDADINHYYFYYNDNKFKFYY